MEETQGTRRPVKVKVKRTVLPVALSKLKHFVYHLVSSLRPVLTVTITVKSAIRHALLCALPCWIFFFFDKYNNILLAAGSCNEGVRIPNYRLQCCTQRATATMSLIGTSYTRWINYTDHLSACELEQKVYGL